MGTLLTVTGMTDNSVERRARAPVQKEQTEIATPHVHEPGLPANVRGPLWVKLGARDARRLIYTDRGRGRMTRTVRCPAAQYGFAAIMRSVDW
jgi:hypothetical protein